MTNKHKSSIEYLAHELNSLSMDYLTGQITNKEYNERYDRIIEQTKVMHEEEIMAAHESGMEDGYYFEGSQYDYEAEGTTKYFGEQYYNEKFGDNNNS